MSRSGRLTGLLPASAFRPSGYIGTARRRLWRRALPVVALLLALPAGACSYQLGSMFGHDEAKSETTGSIALSPRASDQAATAPVETDLVYARAAASEALSIDGKTTSVPWENPQTGARGTITPLAVAYTQDGFVCRDFLASYVRQGSESWMQGEGCRIHQGKWEIRAMRPWKKT
jgi:surface antigen